MAHPTGNQCIHCSVESCQYHARDNMCSLSDIKVKHVLQLQVQRLKG